MRGQGGPESARVFLNRDILEATLIGGFCPSLHTVLGKAPKWGQQKVESILCGWGAREVPKVLECLSIVSFWRPKV